MKRSSSTHGEKLPTKEPGNYFTYFSPSAEDEDVCPTCLEDYTSENPRIVMQCSHHFHLGCIYEWMERSEACPVCGKADYCSIHFALHKDMVTVKPLKVGG
ncbi:hypothetical protein OsI_36751 [Oryza sativa Indica Group]|uniref:RING-type E3 ubiquitin transferase n=1 Tax=Oryza sativa subsp. indica TaxID=39946 RepID=A2ZG51_ORYSI|nr:hypothetical protein OsI_36751 [Oryza sativa Indica Group]